MVNSIGHSIKATTVEIMGIVHIARAAQKQLVIKTRLLTLTFSMDLRPFVFG